MSRKDQVIFIFLCLITFGVYYLMIRSKSKTTKQVNHQLSSTTKILTNVTKLRQLLGGEKNILSVEHTHTKVKIIFKNKTLIQLEALEKLKGVSGIFITSQNLTLIVGNQAKELAKIL